MKITKSKLRKIIKEELAEAKKPAYHSAWQDDPNYEFAGHEGEEEEPQYATVAGAKQDIQRRARGGAQGAYGDLPWVRAAVEDLEDAEYDVRAQALEALADELGISIKQGYFEQNKSL